MPQFSVVLPVRNGGKYVKQCVLSILAQVVTDFNLIVLDNASTDGTLEWIDALKDKRIVIYPSKESLTIEENWSRALEVPKNDFLTLIGHDDILDPNYLQTMVQLIRKHPSASLYQTHFRYIDSTGQQIRKCQPMDETQSAAEFTAFILKNTIDSMGTGFMLRSVDYERIGGIPLYPNLLFADFELWINSAMIGYKATSMEESFAFRLHQSTTVTSPNIKFQQSFQRFIGFLEDLQQLDDRYRLVIERYALYFISKYCRGLSHRLLRTPLKNREGYTVTGFVRQCKAYADRLVPNNDYDPFQDRSIKVAALLDSNSVNRNLFLLFKKIYSRPLYS